MTIAIVTLNYILPLLGVYQVIVTTIKITKGYRVSRWFF